MIFQNLPQLNGNEEKYVLDCLETNWLSSTGPYVTKFEEYFANYCGVAHAAACSSGTTAIHLALLASGVGFGDEVIVPNFTLIADANMVILAGAKPVFVDIDPETWCIDPEKIEEKITERTKAIICVHMFGHPCDMQALGDIAKKHKLVLIEDAAQAHGTEYKGKKAGSLADISCFSFYATKTLTTGEGGLVLSDNSEYDEKIRLLRSHGFEGKGRTYRHSCFGFNYRLTNIQAAIGLAQCEALDQKIKDKRRVAASYYNLLENQKGIRLQVERPWALSTYWNVAIEITSDFGCSRDEIIKHLGEKEIQARLVFEPLNSQPVYLDSQDPRYPTQQDETFEVSQRLGANAICLPSSIELSESEISTVVEELLSCRK